MASGFLGVALARWASAPRPIWRLAFAGILLVLTGLLTTIVIPINKDLWTASFVLVTSGIGASGYAAVRAAWPVLQPHGWARSEERRVGKECVSTCRYRWSPSH